MYAQMTTIQVSLNQIDHLREVIASSYLPVIRAQPGFRAGFLLEKEDESECAYLVVFWASQADVEKFNNTGMLQTSLHALAVDISCINLQRESYVVSVSAQADRIPT